MDDHDNLPSATCNTQLGTGPLTCDAWHHYYHYQSSAQYLWLGETFKALGREGEALTAYKRSLFQDHLNEEAKEGLGRKGGAPIGYDKHPLYDLQFRSLIGERPDDATKPHDHGVTALLAGDSDHAMLHLNKATALNPDHSNSFFTRGKMWFLRGDYEQARADFTEAIRLSHLRHETYHRLASLEHVARGREFLRHDQTDLAISDFTKALDLYGKNREALAARANAYRLKGNARLAEEDERKLTLL